MNNESDKKIGLPLGPSPEKVQKTSFDEKAFAEYLKYQFLCLKNIKTDDICTENNSDEAQEKHVSMSKAFIDLEFSEDGRNVPLSLAAYLKMQYEEKESILKGDWKSKNNQEEKCFVKNTWNRIRKPSSNSENKRIVYLLGCAGAGKSTLTQFIALLSWATWLKNHNYYSSDAEEFLNEQKTRNYISETSDPQQEKHSPLALRIKLSEYGRFIDELKNKKEAGLNDFFAFNCWFDLKCRDNKNYRTTNSKYEDWINESDRPGMAQDILHFYDKLLKESNYQLVFLLDGLDEVKVARDILVAKIQSFLRIFVVDSKNDNIAIVTSRYEKMDDLIDSDYIHEEGEDDARDASLKKNKESMKDHIRKCELLSLSISKVEECVHDFCTAKYNRADAADTEATILAAYLNKKNIRDIMKTPLEVTMICLVYQGNREIPGNDAKLYKSYIYMYYSREKSKLLTDDRYRSFLECEYTEDFVYHLLKWSCFRLEIEGMARLKKEDIRAEIKNYNTREEDGYTYKVYESVTDKYINLLIEFTFERLNLFSPYYNEGYEMDGDIHKTVKEFLSAYYVLTENKDQFADNIIKMQLKEENKTLEFITYLLINSADKGKDIAYTNEIKEDFCTGQDDHLDRLKSAIKLGTPIAGKRFALPIYEHDRSFEPRLITAWTGQFALDADAEQDALIGRFFSRYDSNTVQRDRFFDVLDQSLNEGVFNVNIFKVLMYIIENDIAVDPVKYKGIANMLSRSDLINGNILQTARKYKQTIPQRVLEKILNKGVSINIFEKGVRAVNDLKTIILVEQFRKLIGLNCSIDFDQNYHLVSSEEVVVDYNYSKDDKKYIGLALIHDSIRSDDYFFYSDYFRQEKRDRTKCDDFIKQMIAGLKQCGLQACSDLMNCIIFPDKKSLIRFSEKLSTNCYDEELNGMILPSFSLLVINNSIPARLAIKHFNSTCKLSSKEIVDRYLDARYEEILHAEEKTPMDAFRKIVLLYELLGGMLYYTGRNISKDHLDKWYEQFNEVEHATDLQQYDKYWDMYAFLFSVYEWSCQHSEFLEYDRIGKLFANNNQALEKALFEKGESISGYDQWSLLLYMIARDDFASIADQLKTLSLEKMYSALPKRIDDQLKLNQSQETVFNGASFRAFLKNTYALIQYYGATQYWELLLNSILLLRKAGGDNYAKSFLCEILNESIVPNSDEKTQALFRVVMQIRSLILENYSNVRTVAHDIFDIVENADDDHNRMLKLVVSFMDENFNDDKYKEGTTEFFCELISLTRRCNGKYYDVNLRIEAILRSNLNDVFFPGMKEE